MYFRHIFVISIILFLIGTNLTLQAQNQPVQPQVITPKEAVFKAALLSAIKNNDLSALDSITCADGVTEALKQMLYGSNTSLLQALHKSSDPKFSFSPFVGPSPTPINYQGQKLLPNLEITEICMVEGFQLRLGEKDGKILISSLAPQK